MPDEPPAQYAIRLAARNFVDVRAFSLDMGFNFERLLSGCPNATARLADVSGISLSELAENGLIKEGARYLLKGQMLDIHSLRCARIVVCPECLRQDIERSDLPPATAMYRRVQWALKSIGTCEKHNLALVTAAERLSQWDRQNWSVASLEPKLHELIDGATRRSPSHFEAYLLDRLKGRQTNCWLDNLDFFAAEQAAQLFGTFSLFGNGSPPRDLSDADFYAAGNAGFEIFRGGAHGLGAFLDRVQKEFSRSKTFQRDRTLGPSTIYGRLHARLSAYSKETAFLPLVKVVADHIVTRFPYGPGDFLFHKPVQVRKLHSVLTLSRLFKVSNKRVVKVLTTGGMLPCPGCVDRDAVFDAAEAEDLVRNEVLGLTQANAERYLNVPKNLMENLIHEGFVRRYRASTGVQGYRFSKAELDRFLERMFLDAVPAGPGSEAAMSISRASFHCRASATAIIQIILDRKLRWIGYREDLRGLASLIVHPQDVIDAFCLPHLDGMTVAEVSAKLHIHPMVVRELIKRNLLKASSKLHPVNNRPSLRIAPSELERFDAEYTTLFNLARQLKLDHHLKLKAILADRGIHPAEETIGLDTTFYKRLDLQS